MFFSLALAAQERDISQLKSGMLKNFGKNAERLNDKYTAVNYYRAYILKRPRDMKMMYHLAELEESIRDYTYARDHYQVAFESTKPEYEVALYHKGRMEKMLGDYKQAKKDFERYLTLSKKTIDRDLKKQVTSELLGCDSAMMLLAAPLDIAIGNLGKGVNKAHIEFAPLPLENGDIIFGSLQEDELKSYSLDEARPKRKLFLASKEKGQWVTKGELDIPVNSDEMHTVSGSFSLDGNRFYFTRCSEDWKLQVVCELWVCKKAGGKWKEPVRLSDVVNMPGYSSSQPTVGLEAKTGREVIYFVSDRPEGVGGDDIWFTRYDQKKDSYSSPRNLGRGINTPRDEMSPFYHETEKKLYYSTEGRSGLGGFDVYVARGEMKKWLPSINVGAPINSSVDDIYYVLKPSGDSGFLVSNRKGGQQILHETCCDDIYEFFELDPLIINVEGTAWQADEQDYLSGRTDDLKNSAGKGKLADATVLVYIKEDGQEVLMRTLKTDADGKFITSLEPDKEYRFEVTKDGFLNNDVSISTMGIKESVNLKRGMGLSPVMDGSFVIENIEYEFNSYNLTPAAKQSIDESLMKVLLENPDLKIEIGSHTDNIGSDDYNRKLSQQRAESVVKYLTSNGIDSKRLVAKGYGESKPLVPNENKDGSDNEANRQRNRRTEFKIIGRIPVAFPIDEDE